MANPIALEQMVDVLKAVAEPSRLRIVTLLKHGDLTVTDFTTILGQSQPRVSRHLRLLLEAHVIERYQEGAWAYFRLADEPVRHSLMMAMLDQLDQSDHILELDYSRLKQVKEDRQAKASHYFSTNAARWDEVRLLHAPDNKIEHAMQEIIGKAPFQSMLDIGTGTGSLLKLFAPLYVRGLGIDINRDMLAVARVNLDNAGITHAQVRHGDVATLPVDRESVDLVTIYQVLHFLDDPQVAIREAARVIRPDGRLLIVDFASHNLDYLREEFAHIRLGFSDRQMKDWLEESGFILEETLEFRPQDKTQQNGLNVKLWSARDQRYIIADTKKVEMA